MPIKRLQRTEGQPQFPNIGKLRKGGERPATGKAPGKDLEYFRFTSDDERALTMFEAAYGKEPQAINVYLPMPTTDENFSSWQEAWVAGGLQHRCDGETCTIWLKPDGTYSQEPKPCPGGCKEVGRLMVIIPELQRMAYVTAETHSINDIITITDNLSAIESIAGTLTGIPFVLKRVAREISTPGQDGKRARRTKWMLSIEVDPVWAALRFDSMHRQALTTASGNHPMLVDSLSDFEDYEHSIDDDDDEDGPADANEPFDKEQAFAAILNEINVEHAPEDTAAHVATPRPKGDPPVFSTMKDGLEWAVKFGAFSNVTEAKREYMALKATKSNAEWDKQKNLWRTTWIEYCTIMAGQEIAA